MSDKDLRIVELEGELDRVYERLLNVQAELIRQKKPHNAHGHIRNIMADMQMSNYAYIKKISELLDSEPLQDLSISVEDYEFGIRAINIMRREGIKTIGDLISMTQIDLLRLDNMGKLTIKGIEDTLREHGLYLNGMEPL